jgi:CBS domain-containing protein
MKKGSPAMMIPKKSNPEFTKVQELVYKLKVRDAMTRDLISADPGTWMRELREILRSNRISGAPVIKEDTVSGDCL